ncbi:MAG: hypothetical protein ABIT10_01145 [Alteraurantiacibacter sp.]
MAEVVWMAEMRLAGVAHFAQVDWAILETQTAAQWGGRSAWQLLRRP